MKARISVLIFAVLVLSGLTFGQSQMTETQYVQRFMAMDSWTTSLMLVPNSKPTSGSIHVDLSFYDQNGKPITVPIATNKKLSPKDSWSVNDLMFTNKYSVDIPNGDQQILSIVRDTPGAVYQGWVKIEPNSLLLAHTTLNQYQNGQEGHFTIDATDFRPGYSIVFNSNTGAAITNIGNVATKVTFTFEVFGGSTYACTVTLNPGQQWVGFFYQLTGATGKTVLPAGANGKVVIISANTPIVGVAFEFYGTQFDLVPMGPTERRLDIPSPTYGVVEVTATDNYEIDGLEDRIGSDFPKITRSTIDEEFRRHGKEPVNFWDNFARNESGKIVVRHVQLKGPRSDYIDSTSYNHMFDPHKILDEIPYYPDWQFSFIVVNCFDQSGTMGVSAYGLPRSSSGRQGYIMVTGEIIPFLRADWIGNKNSVRDYLVPELHNMPAKLIYDSPLWKEGIPFEETAGLTAALITHEIGHSLGYYGHDYFTGDNDFFYKFVTLMSSGCSGGGCFLPDSQKELVLSPNSAETFAVSLFGRGNSNAWIQEDLTPPNVSVIASQYNPMTSTLHFKASADDPESGVMALLIFDASYSLVPLTFYWKRFGHDEQVSIDLTLNIKNLAAPYYYGTSPDFGAALQNFFPWAIFINWKGGLTYVNLNLP